MHTYRLRSTTSMLGCVTVLLVMFYTAQAGAQVLDFEDADFDQDGIAFGVNGFTEEGYTVSFFTNPENAIFRGVPGINGNGTAVLGWASEYGEHGPIISSASGETFSVQSIDIAFLSESWDDHPPTWAGWQVGDFEITVVAYNAVGAIPYRFVYGEEWSTLTPALGAWDDLTSLHIGYAGYEDYSDGWADVAIDNIVLNDGLVEIIPEPTTCALFALGALACGHTARRRRKRMQKRS